MMQMLAAEHVGNKRVIIIIVGKHDMPAHIPGESGVVTKTGRESARVVLFFKDDEILATEFPQSVSRTQAGRACADD